MFLQLGRAAQGEKLRNAFFLGEIQFVKEHELRALISVLHRAMQKQLPLTLAAAGLPVYIQEFGKHIWNLAPYSPITLGDVDRATSRPEESLDRESVPSPKQWEARRPKCPRYARSCSIAASPTRLRTMATPTWT